MLNSAESKKTAVQLNKTGVVDGQKHTHLLQQLLVTAGIHHQLQNQDGQR